MEAWQISVACLYFVGESRMAGGPDIDDLTQEIKVVTFLRRH